MKSEYKLVSDAVLGTDLHLSEEYIANHIGGCMLVLI